MAVYRAQIGFQLDSALPRDAITINPHYFGDDPQALADRLKTNLLAHPPVAATTPFTVKVYDAQKAPPSYPLATASSGSGFKATNNPREIALCLSYYSTWNRPTYRGRLYIPYAFISGGITIRPSDVQLADVMLWKNVLTSGLPAGTNWVVYSRKMNQSYGVSNVWVDDEWDVVRSRGLKPTKRSAATVP